MKFTNYIGTSLYNETMIIIPRLWFYNKCYAFQLLLVTLCMSLLTELMAHPDSNIFRIHLWYVYFKE